MKTYYDEVKKIYDEYVKVILPKTVTWVSDGTDVDYIYGTEPYVKIPPKKQYPIELEVKSIKKGEPHVDSELSAISHKLTELSLIIDGLKYEYDIDEKDIEVVHKLIAEIEEMVNESR